MGIISLCGLAILLLFFCFCDMVRGTRKKNGLSGGQMLNILPLKGVIEQHQAKSKLGDEGRAGLRVAKPLKSVALPTETPAASVPESPKKMNVAPLFSPGGDLSKDSEEQTAEASATPAQIKVESELPVSLSIEASPAEIPLESEISLTKTTRLAAADTARRSKGNIFSAEILEAVEVEEVTAGAIKNGGNASPPRRDIEENEEEEEEEEEFPHHRKHSSLTRENTAEILEAVEEVTAGAIKNGGNASPPQRDIEENEEEFSHYRKHPSLTQENALETGNDRRTNSVRREHSHLSSEMIESSPQNPQANTTRRERQSLPCATLELSPKTEENGLEKEQAVAPSPDWVEEASWPVESRQTRRHAPPVANQQEKPKLVRHPSASSDSPGSATDKPKLPIAMQQGCSLLMEELYYKILSQGDTAPASLAPTQKNLQTPHRSEDWCDLMGL